MQKSADAEDRGSGEKPLILHAFIHVCHLFGITVIEQGRDLFAAAKRAFGRLAPAGMRNLRVHIRPEAVLAGLHLFPERNRTFRSEREADNGFGRFEAVFPRYRQPQRGAVLAGMGLP